MTKDLLIFDIDGTLTDTNHIISDETIKALNDLSQKGHEIALATGRHIYTSAVYFKHFPFLKYSLHLNGGIIYRHSDQKIIYHDTFKEDTYQKLVNFFRDNNLSFMTFRDNGNYQEINNELIDLSKMNITQNQFQCEDFSKLDNIIKIMLMPDTEEIQNKIQNFIKDLDLHAFGTGFGFYEIMNKKTSKGNSLEKLCQILNHPIEKTIAFGDNQNDKEMLAMANIGIAMGSAPQDVKDIADYITDSSDDNGIVNALKVYKLI